MSRVRMFGLCSVGLVVLALAAAGSASAEPPEFGRCVKAPNNGAFETGTCTTTNPTHIGKWEWAPGLAHGGVTFAGKPETSPPNFTSSGFSIGVTCSGGVRGSGTVAGPQEVTGVALRFTGCREEVTGEPRCTTPGLETGEVEASGLTGRLGFITRSPAVVGLLLESLGEQPFVAVGCPAMSSLWDGIIVKVRSNAMVKAQSLLYKDVHFRGQQQYKQFEGAPPEVLHLNSAQGREVALQASVVLTFEEKAEVSALL